ncbi:response regulator transcription factor [Fonticella tunisiensis]|uniref:Stage 0 sporulation protein A homolog n=1 Tax=Fonticella tunisiensis TaxID=1096341 RepID=A0A4R7KU98_9CLOT|nr:response regulator transcription factor [Fonticella tunisiensis]TDT63643.1 DNA-binding response OmpR family regulator [Fonticella tunisiensis]
MSCKKILIIEDEEMIAESIKGYLERDGFKVYTEQNGRQGLDKFYRLNPDLVILDLMLPELSGEDICISIRKTSRVPIIMLTAKVEEEDVLRGLDIGADDYITKPFGMRELAGRIKAVLRRVDNDPQPLFSKMSFNGGDLEFDIDKNEVRKKGELLRLTPSEYKILLSLLKYPQKTFTREELIYIALGQSYEGYTRTIDTHIKNLRSKIETDIKNPQYIITVHGFGYKFGGEKYEV